MKKKKKRRLIIILVVMLIAGFLYWQNNHIQVSIFSYKANVDKPLTLIHLTDLHNKDFGEQLIKKVESVKPDYILLTGDMIDCKHCEEDDASLRQLEELVKLAPCFFVSGNHEKNCDNYTLFYRELEKIGVKVINDKVFQPEEGIFFLGLDHEEDDEKCELALEALHEKVKHLEGIRILLAHRPDRLSLYDEYEMDLIFSGHAHGGQFRIPYVGGLIAPDQGFFPKFTEGIYKEGNATMVLSRGLGNSIIPFRIFNRPQIIVMRIGE